MILREALDATGMKIRLHVAGKTKFGIGVTGTWAGTLTFRQSFDGVNFQSMSVTPFASGTDVSTATANGNWERAVQNATDIEVEFTRTSGTAIIKLAAANDSSYQDAFLAASTIHVNAEGTSTVTLTQAAQANRAWNLEELIVSIAGPDWAGGTVFVAVYDGAVTDTLLFKTFLSQTAGSVGRQYTIALPAEDEEGNKGIVGTPGNAMTIRLFGLGATQTGELNAKFSAA